MDNHFNLGQFAEDGILACMSACSRVDHLGGFNNDPQTPDPEVLRQNAGIDRAGGGDERQTQIAEGTFLFLKNLHSDGGGYSLSNASIKKTHRELFQFSPRDEAYRGRYRDELDMKVSALCEASRRVLERPDAPALFIVSLFRACFLEIMPFITGNGHTVNVIAYALLYSYGFTAISGIPLLAALNDPPENISADPLAQLPDTIAYLLKSRNTGQLVSSGPDSFEPYLNPRRRDLLEFIRGRAPVKISDIMGHFTDESRNTIKKDLLFLREKGLILHGGEGRGMVYRAIAGG